MENQTAFDLNLAIRHWRENLGRSSALKSENLNELESHLRDSIDRLRARELSDEEAFLVATKRVGPASALEHEFGKVNGAAVWFDRSLWVLVTIQLWTLISSGSTLLLSFASLAGTWFNDLLPGFGLKKIGNDWLNTGFALVFSPIPVAIVTALVWRYFIWPKRRGSAVLQKLLQQPGTLAVALFLGCLSLQFVAAWAFQTYYYPTIAHNVYPPGQQWRLWLFRLPTMTLWAALTFFIARKRLRSSLA